VFCAAVRSKQYADNIVGILHFSDVSEDMGTELSIVSAAGVKSACDSFSRAVMV
jgi:hypothetical protein